MLRGMLCPLRIGVLLQWVHIRERFSYVGIGWVMTFNGDGYVTQCF